MGIKLYSSKARLGSARQPHRNRTAPRKKRNSRLVAGFFAPDRAKYTPPQKARRNGSNRATAQPAHRNRTAKTATTQPQKIPIFSWHTYHHYHHSRRQRIPPSQKHSIDNAETIITITHTAPEAQHQERITKIDIPPIQQKVEDTKIDTIQPLQYPKSLKFDTNTRIILPTIPISTGEGIQ